MQTSTSISHTNERVLKGSLDTVWDFVRINLVGVVALPFVKLARIGLSICDCSRHLKSRISAGAALL